MRVPWQLDVAHVVQFDFAKSAADYVHRCGRTARAGKAGAVTSLVTKSDLDLVKAIRDAQKRGDDLIAAGEEQQRKQRQRAATELVPAVRSNRNPTAPRGGGAATFPDCSGLGGPSPAFPSTSTSSRGGGSDGGRGRGRGRGGGGARGRGSEPNPKRRRRGS